MRSNGFPRCVGGRFQLQYQLGVGASGKVFKATDLCSHLPVAIKLIDTMKIKDLEMGRMIQAELNILPTLNHPNIIKYIGSLEEGTKLSVVYGLCEGGDLYHRMKKEGTLAEPQALMLIGQLSKALCYLQEMNIIHRDIKPENILFTQDKAVLGDFGFAIRGKSYVDKGSVGSLAFIAPEILNSHEFSFQTDIYALGIVLYEVLFGTLPFPQHMNGQSAYRIKMQLDLSPANLPKHISAETARLLQWMCHPNPQSRITCTQLFTESFRAYKALTFPRTPPPLQVSNETKWGGSRTGPYSPYPSFPGGEKRGLHSNSVLSPSPSLQGRPGARLAGLPTPGSSSLGTYYLPTQSFALGGTPHREFGAKSGFF